MLLAAVLAATAVPAASRVPILEAAVAGVRLRDDPGSVRGKLADAGYRIVSVDPAPSFQQRLDDARARQLGNVPPPEKPHSIGSIAAVLDDQRIAVRFDDDEAGRPVAADITYVASAVAHPYGRVLAELSRRQGPPTRTRPYGAAWCAGGSDCDVGTIPSSDKLEVRSETDLRRDVTSIRLEVGESTLDAWKHAHGEALSRLMQTKDAF